MVGGLVRDVSSAAVALLNACLKTFSSEVIEYFRVVWEECEKICVYFYV